MKLLYCHDNFYSADSGGIVYSEGQFSYEYWYPFLHAFDDILIAGRYKPTGPDSDFTHLNQSSGPHLDFMLLPNINGPVHWLKNYRCVKRELTHAIHACDAVVVRAVSDIGWITYNLAKKMNKPVAFELSACAWDSTWNHGHPASRIYALPRYWFNRVMAAGADCTLSVSETFLPQRYPIGGEYVVASNVRLNAPDESILARRLEKISTHQGPYTLGLIGSLSNNLKGVKYALDALQILNHKTPGAFKLHHIGPGKIAPYQQYAHALGIEHLIQFAGPLQSGVPIMDRLDQIDLYIQPSLQEGVPRAVLEAMSRGCPIVASTVGGIPEILNHDMLHKPRDSKALARLIETIQQDKSRQTSEARRNFERAKDFTHEILMPRRIAFWQSFADLVNQRAVQNNNFDLTAKAPILST